ncbi:MAG: site-specific DNA-methyltransferase [Chloroflexota bacterium]
MSVSRATSGSRSAAASLEERLYYRDARLQLFSADCRELLPSLPAESVDAVVTDPPYHLLNASRHSSLRARNPQHPFRSGAGPRGFMGQRWDGGAVAFEPDLWAEVLRVAKPGAHLLAFGGTRTSHRLATAIEDAGWEIRDCLVWAYASGFPKSRNLGAEWTGWGTALKPAWEPIVMARKPLVGSVVRNVSEHGTGALNIDACRIPTEAGGRPHRVTDPKPETNGAVYAGRRAVGTGFDGGSRADATTAQGRWPANLILGDPIFDGGTPGVVGGRHATSGLLRAGRRRGSVEAAKVCYGVFGGYRTTRDTYGDSGGFSRFFLIPKASRSEREAGLHSVHERRSLRAHGRRNHHPTVKPVALLRHLVRLVMPPDGIVLDPFVGSGTTAIAAQLEGMRCLAIEMEPEYLAIAVARLHAARRGRPRAAQ